MTSPKTDNSLLKNKISLRQEVLNKITKDKINILELYGRENIIWQRLQTTKKLNIIIIEREYKKGLNFYGDNKKYIPNMDLSTYEIIDADAYGNPFDLIDLIINNKTFKQAYFVYTFIRAGFRSLTNNILEQCGIKKEWYRRCRTLFEYKRDYFYQNFLSKKRIEVIFEKEYNNKKYGYFVLKSCIGEGEKNADNLRTKRKGERI